MYFFAKKLEVDWRLLRPLFVLHLTSELLHCSCIWHSVIKNYGSILLHIDTLFLTMKQNSGSLYKAAVAVFEKMGLFL